ncbi:C39 family peptidase [Massilibacterium senegalense]|uniref:C39 family peptidase n=1 Tax=Massilibacterium senegalense TaxID=1632858 RepID=UPI0007812D16|nr:C39 family peptidase [Massilibacterium senegalense]
MKKLLWVLMVIVIVLSGITYFQSATPVTSGNFFETNIEKSRSFYVSSAFRTMGTFHTYSDALAFAKENDASKIEYGKHKIIVWEKDKRLNDHILMDATHVEQMPELPRGCEVTSLTMLLRTNGIDVDKMTLANQIKRDPTPYEQKNGTIYFGNPNFGFVGDMYSFENPGLGVYHGPIRMLAEQYLPNEIVDVTGVEFDGLYYFLSQGYPVWVIINSRFQELPENQFQTWSTPIGKVKITYREHSVLITGYDSQYIYFNDPLAQTKNRKVNKANFAAAWKQMGSQAIVAITDTKPAIIE